MRNNCSPQKWCIANICMRVAELCTAAHTNCFADKQLPLQYSCLLKFDMVIHSQLRIFCVLLCLQALKEIQNLVETCKGLEEKKRRLTRMQSVYVKELSLLSGMYNLCCCMLLHFALSLTLCWFMCCLNGNLLWRISWSLLSSTHLDHLVAIKSTVCLRLIW